MTVWMTIWMNIWMNIWMTIWSIWMTYSFAHSLTRSPGHERTAWLRLSERRTNDRQWLTHLLPDPSFIPLWICMRREVAFFASRLPSSFFCFLRFSSISFDFVRFPSTFYDATEIGSVSPLAIRLFNDFFSERVFGKRETFFLVAMKRL